MVGCVCVGDMQARVSVLLIAPFAFKEIKLFLVCATAGETLGGSLSIAEIFWKLPSVVFSSILGASQAGGRAVTVWGLWGQAGSPLLPSRSLPRRASGAAHPDYGEQ